jgi:uroporphyrinogen decarboxylase
MALTSGSGRCHDAVIVPAAQGASAGEWTASQMDSRERTRLALEHRMGDRIPVDFWASKAMIRKLEQGFGVGYAEFLDRYDVDLRYLEGPAYVGPPLGEGRDIWGVPRTRVNVPVRGGMETYEEVTLSPLAGVERLEDIDAYPHWPSPDWFDYRGIAGQCEAIRSRGRVAVFMGDRLNRVAQLKPAMYLRGMEAILEDLVLRPDLAHAIFSRIREFYTVYLDRILESAKGNIDIVLTGDDFGSQQSLLLSPETWRTFLRPGFRDYVQRIKAHGAKAMHHTCGAVAPLLPDFVDCGLDVLQSLQPEAAGMALADLKARCGDRLCFHGGLSIQRTLPFGTADQIRAQVRRIAEQAGGDGGYIFCTAHNIQADTPVENVGVLLEAYREFGRRAGHSLLA